MQHGLALLPPFLLFPSPLVVVALQVDDVDFLQPELKETRSKRQRKVAEEYEADEKSADMGYLDALRFIFPLTLCSLFHFICTDDIFSPFLHRNGEKERERKKRGMLIKNSMRGMQP